MPIYEYRCDKCEREFEAEQRITEAPIRSCPHCRSRRVRRLISKTAFVLKGGGWYSDLYSSSRSKPEAADKGGAAEAKSSEATPAASESKGSESPKGTPGPDSGGKGKKPESKAKAAA